MEIILPLPQDRLSISLNDLLNCDFGMEHLDNRLCKSCNNSNTSEVTTSIHTHPDVLIIMLQRNCWNNNLERINTQVKFPVNGFASNQGLDNDEMPTEYNLFAAICHKESRNKASGNFTAQYKIKGSNGYWIKYGNADFRLNNFINSRNRTRAMVKYHPLAYFLFYIRRDPAVSSEIGLQGSPER
jgi:ubiquitin C-terminal hydrolase